MTKPKRKRQHVTPIKQESILDKRFKRVAKASTRVTDFKVHSLLVLADLRKGCLSSLDRYLKQEKGLPDRAVAVELRKLISGSAHRTGHKLLVIEHPDMPKHRSERSLANKDQANLKRYGPVVASYERILPSVGGKAYLAREQVADEFGCDESTVKRAIRTVQQARKRAQERVQTDDVTRQASAQIVERRRAALAKLRE